MIKFGLLDEMFMKSSRTITLTDGQYLNQRWPRDYVLKENQKQLKATKFDLEQKQLKSAKLNLEATKTNTNTKIELDVSKNTLNKKTKLGLETTDNTTVKSGIGSKAELKTGETLNAKVSFGGSILYKGTPEVKQTKKVAGGIIKQMN